MKKCAEADNRIEKLVLEGSGRERGNERELPVRLKGE